MTSLAIMAQSRLRDERARSSQKKPQLLMVSARPGHPSQGLLRFAGKTMRCALGKSGIGILKREGDGKTPLAKMAVLYGFYRKDRWPALARQPWLLPVNQSLGWCDAPHDANYNRSVRLPYQPSHETLTREDGLYDCVIVLGWNIRPRAQNRGSAIFMHIARPGYKPTEGCIAVSRRDMVRLLKTLKPGALVTTA